MKAKRIFSLFLVLVLMFGIGGGIVQAAETGTDMNASTQDQQETEQSAEGSGTEGETAPGDETQPPTEATNPPAPEATAAPTPEPTAAPVESPAPTEVPEIGPPVVDGPSIDEPYGDGIVMGPNNPPEDGPVIFSTISGTAAIAVHNCYMSNGTQIKYVGSFYWNGHDVGGSGSPRYQITANGSPAYCIEPGTYLPGGSTVSTNAATVWNGFSVDKRNAIKVALLCGEPGNSSNLSGNYGSQYTATQMIIWEIIVGTRSTSSPYSCSDSKVINSVCSGGANSEVKTVYDQISNAMRSYSVLPSFVSSLGAPPPSSEMTYQNGNFTITLTDSNNVLSNYSFSSDNSNLHFNVSGNQLTITSPSAVENAMVDVKKKTAISASSTITAYAASGLQETIVGVEALDDISGWFSVFAEAAPPPASDKATVTIRKTAEDGNISNIHFTIDGIGMGSKHIDAYTDRYGMITQELEPGDYMITEQTPSGYTPTPHSKQITLQSGDNVSLSFYNAVTKGALLVVKSADDGAVSGIEFTISGPSGTQSGYTSTGGQCGFVNLIPGTYTVTEQVPSGYEADHVSQTVVVEENKVEMVYFHNSVIKRGTVRIVKTSDDGAVSGITFTVSGPDGIKTATTGADGTVDITDLSPGSYTVTEQVPAGYTADKPTQQFTLMPGELYTVEVHNTVQKGGLRIVKTSDDGVVNGIKFTVQGGTINSTYPTDANGVISIIGLTPGTYSITENVPEGYNADQETQTVTVKSGDTTTVNFHNTRSVGGIKIVKESDDGAVSGIQFRVQGNGVDQNVATGSDGTINVPGLIPGEYTVTEIVPEGYVSENATQTVTVRANDSVSVFFKNVPKQWRVAVTKVDAEPSVRRNTRITLEGAQYGVYKDGTLRDTYTTDAHGQFTTNYYPCGTGWTLQEIAAPPGYTVDPTSYSIGLTPGSAQLATNETELTVPEEVIKGKLIITKQDANTKTPLEGALFRVFDEDGATVTEGTTGADGTFTVEELPFGVYSAQEITPPSGYMLDDTPFEFTVETDGQEIRITRDNYPAIGSITVHKVDSQGTNLSGAAYLLEYSVNGSGWVPVSFRQDNMAVAGGCTSLGLQNGQLITGDDGTVFFDGLLADGKTQYRLTETQAPAGLSLLKDPIYTGTLPAQGESEAEYDIAFTVTNNRVTTLPQTGGNGMFWPAAIGTALLGLSMCAGAYYVTKKMRKENH